MDGTRRLPRVRAALFLMFLAHSLAAFSVSAQGLRHYVFFNRDRERITEASFLETRGIEGAQIKYTWKQLEPAKGEYSFDDIRHDLAFLSSKGKKLFIQVQDASFDESIVPLPRYLVTDPAYHGGANRQYAIPEDDESRATPGGWVARRWDPAVRERFHRLLGALGKEFDGKVEGINLPETAVDFGETGKLFPPGFTRENYRDAVVENMKALKRAFPKSVAMQYANFMPEEKDPEGPAYLKSVYRAGAELGVGLGGPDLLPNRPWQMRHSYPLLREVAGRVPTGIAVQDGNYAAVDPKAKRRHTVAELTAWGKEQLGVQYIFWCTEEPFYSGEVIPFLRSEQAGRAER